MREVSISAIIPATLMARRAFYALGRRLVYTNSYKDCHTVKAYRTGSNNTDTEFADKVCEVLWMAGHRNTTWHVTDGERSGAIIIRIPK
jgi:hypothetical protein